MKRTLRVYKKTVSIVNETAIGMYQNLVGDKVGFLLESYDKNYDRYTFMGVEPEELISSVGQSLVITKADGSREVRNGNPLDLLKEYYSEFEIKNDHAELNFSGGLVGQLGYDFIRYSEVLPDNNGRNWHRNHSDDVDDKVSDDRSCGRDHDCRDSGSR